ncbi:MAG: ACT domain-containing protein [Firmicutes bacterium]|nr:ACT domain-containing protein [Bacillota bacterium]
MSIKDDDELYVIDKKVLPEIFLKVTGAKRLLERGEASSVQDATEKVGISRSAFYKYRDHCFTLTKSSRGKTVIIAFNLLDKAGILSNVLNIIASKGGNVLTINQTIPINGVANVTISIAFSGSDSGFSSLLDDIAAVEGVKNIKIIARE